MSSTQETPLISFDDGLVFSDEDEDVEGPVTDEDPLPPDEDSKSSDSGRISSPGAVVRATSAHSGELVIVEDVHPASVPNPNGNCWFDKLPCEILAQIAEEHKEILLDSSWPYRFLGSTANFASINRRTRDASIRAMFNGMSLHTSEVNLSTRLQAVENRDGILKSVRFFTLSVSSMIDAGDRPNGKLPSRLAGMIKRMPFLEDITLEFVGSSGLANSFGTALNHLGVSFAHLKVFDCQTPGINIEDLSMPFPQLKVFRFAFMDGPISSVAFRQFVHRQQLQEILLKKKDWTLDSFRDIVKPLSGQRSLRNLTFDGWLYEVRVSDLVDVLSSKLSKLKMLRHLTLTAQQLIVPREDEEPFHADDLALLSRTHPLNEYVDDNALQIFEDLPSLHSVRLPRF
ncbi:hypothetical protein CkaCkLH20_10038 [Colletotrichum karsti]|uniref:Uncharacterized protein n=1 Tax=Colletotrichum karsti TaxID=1095194 RepID=A0A9P6I1Y7_9PEZI|nr:uncharacterized protein CkaCkLH20_10038 [Colletotrichum karsti]KAF9872541.1 hypothetical protein CkaCkLH20_10038 [Colletotrichum karsti]